MKVAILLAMIVVMRASVAVPTSAEERGTLRGRFVYDGEPPKPKMIKISKDVGVCGKEILDESLLVHADNRGIANVVVWLDAKEPPKHPRLDALLREPALLTMQGCRYEPHIAVVTVGQKLQLDNNDAIGHNPKYDVMRNKPNHDLWPARSTLTKQFSVAEVLPVTTSCAIHPWMRGYLVIFDHPYVAVADANGEFSIPEIPQGVWTFRVWHETAGFVRKVKREGRDVDWPKGRFMADVTPNKDSDFGEILVPAELFQE
jgi:hypothetical protein